uniref:Zinc metalloproteinase n=1 Tax=Panagrolaimus sp. PS1159 TaxID=55785 RepID=A0AC35G067_9BILA
MTSNILYKIFIFILLLTLISGERTKKASPSTLNKIKELINRKAEREVVQADVGRGLNDAVVEVIRNPDAKHHFDELSVNDPDQYFQGDVELSEKQADKIQEQLLDDLQADEPKSKRKKRKVGKEPLYKRWSREKPISYEFAENIPELTRFKIRDALRIWEQHTCIRFRENGPDIDRLEFYDGGGCSSFVGRAGGTQGISISTPGCDIVGIITHEVGHALGLFHEQARPDQQEHIAVHYGNIPIGRWNNFHPVTGNQADTFLLPYDAGSVMHYGAYGFANDPYRPTISTLDKNLQSTIGQRAGPSFLDFEAINMAYNCLDHCPTLSCTHGGYVNPNDCTKCSCPPGFSGRTCQEVQFSNCGAKIMVSTEPITISTPQFPEYFSSNSYCVWLIQAPPGGKVFLQFTDAFHYQCEDTCDKSYVEVHPGPDFSTTGYRFCCARIPTQQFVSFSNEMLVFHNGWGDQGRGFKATVWSNVASIATILPSPPLPPLTEITYETTTTPSTTTTSALTTPRRITPKKYVPTQPPIPELFIISTSRKVTTAPRITSTTEIVTTTEVATTTSTTTTETTTIEITTIPFTEAPTTPIPQTFFTFPQPTPPQIFKPFTPIVPISPIVPVTTDDCACGPWSIWQDTCSQQCGGCGKRTRRRECTSTDNCRTEDKRPCNFEACPTGTNFLINNGEFHILWKGCCVGLFRSQKGQCTALDEGENPFLRIISSLLTTQDSKKNKNATLPIDSKFH